MVFLSILLEFLFFVQTLNLALQDWKERHIYTHDVFFVGLTSFCLIFGRSSFLLSFSSIASIFFIMWLIKYLFETIKMRKIFGWGDLWVLPVLVGLLPFSKGAFFFMLSGGLGLLFRWFYPSQKNKIPLVTLLIISFWISRLS